MNRKVFLRFVRISCISESGRLRKPSPFVEGTKEFRDVFQALSWQSYLYKIIDKGLDKLKENMFVGRKVQKRKWPKEYVEKYGITNLWRLNLDRYYRLIYFITIREGDIFPVVIEVLGHPEYNRKFGYRST